jgi:hypothetical protein
MLGKVSHSELDSVQVRYLLALPKQPPNHPATAGCMLRALHGWIPRSSSIHIKVGVLFTRMGSVIICAFHVLRTLDGVVFLLGLFYGLLFFMDVLLGWPYFVFSEGYLNLLKKELSAEQKTGQFRSCFRLDPWIIVVCWLWPHIAWVFQLIN